MVDNGCTSEFFNEEAFEVRLSASPLGFHENSLNNTSQTSIESTDSFSLSLLTLDEPEPVVVQPFFNISPRPLPLSPHYIIEEEFSSNPWAMLIATIFLTKTSGKVARPYIRRFFKDYPTPYHVLSDPPVAFEKFFDNLGLRKRGHMIWKLSYQFVSAKWRRASDLCGIGKYGEDAYRIFCLGHLEVDPDDRYLRLYLDWLRRHTEFMGNNGIMDSEYVIEDPVLKYYNVSLRNTV